MTIQIKDGTMMVREGLLLPDSARIESASYSNTWRTLVGLDSFAFDRKLRDAAFHLFFIAGELKVIALGRGPSAVRRGMKRMLGMMLPQSVPSPEDASCGPQLRAPFSIGLFYSLSYFHQPYSPLTELLHLISYGLKASVYRISIAA